VSALLNSYRGGIPTRTSESWSLSQGFRFGTAQERLQLSNARDRALHAYRNNPVARTLVQTETDHVVGDGLNYQPTSSSADWNKEAEDKYYEWLEVASVRGPAYHPGCQLQRILWQSSRIAGDVGWILVARGLDSRIQIVPSENIVTPDGMYTDRAVYDGVRFDSTGAPTTFYVMYTEERAAQRKFEPVPARDFVFFPHLASPDAARGETCYQTIFDLLAHLDRYVDGVSLAAWMATVMGIIFKQNNAAKQQSLLGSLTNSQGQSQKAITFENGMVKYIGTDEDVAQVQASQPMQQTPEFIRTMFRMLGQPFDMPLEVIAKDMSTCNFASARIGLLPFYRTCRVKASRFGESWSRTIRWWLSRERLRPDGDPKKWKTAFPADYWNHDLLPNAFEYTDPVSDAQSDHLQLDMRTKSPQMVIAERGRNAAKILREWEEWNEQTKDLKQFHSTMTRDEMQVAAEPQPENEEAPEDRESLKQEIKEAAVDYVADFHDETMSIIKKTLQQGSPQ
jgi:capsid protein